MDKSVDTASSNASASSAVNNFADTYDGTTFAEDLAAVCPMLAKLADGSTRVETFRQQVGPEREEMRRLDQIRRDTIRKKQEAIKAVKMANRKVDEVKRSIATCEERRRTAAMQLPMQSLKPIASAPAMPKGKWRAQSSNATQGVHKMRLTAQC